MKKLTLITLFSLTFLSTAQAKEESIRDFATSLEKLFAIGARKTLEVGDGTRFRPQINPNGNAEASYNPTFNMILLKKENLISNGSSYIVKSIDVLKREQPTYYPIKISTIFHELGHAEMDQFILKGLTSEDRTLVSLYKNEFTPWVQRNYPGVNPKTLFHEFYGYYRGAAIETLFQDKSTIEVLNGFNIYQRRCFNSVYLKKMVGTLSREDFGELLYPDNDPNWEQKYSNKFFPRYVFIQGKDVDLMKNPADPFKESWKQIVWNYFSVNYHAPQNMRELAVHFKASHEDRNFIKECRNKMWDEFHALKIGILSVQ